jgi:hypothetical protein
MPYVQAILGAIQIGLKLYGASQHPDVPEAPKLHGLDVQKAKTQMEDYEAKRMQTSIDEWKTKFPELYKGGAYMAGTTSQQQAGMLGGSVALDMKAAGLQAPREGNQYQLSQDIGLSPITLSQRTSQAVSRQIAQNPEWTNQITGGTLATMIANNYKNQNAYTQFLGANRTAMYAQGKAAGAYNTQALLSGITGLGGIGASLYNQAGGGFGPTSPTGQGIYQATQPTSTWTPPVQTGAAGVPPWQQMYNAPTTSAMTQGAFGMPGTAPGPGTGYGLGGNFWDPNQMTLGGPSAAPTGGGPYGNDNPLITPFF